MLQGREKRKTVILCFRSPLDVLARYRGLHEDEKRQLATIRDRLRPMHTSARARRGHDEA